MSVSTKQIITPVVEFQAHEYNDLSDAQVSSNSKNIFLASNCIWDTALTLTSIYSRYFFYVNALRFYTKMRA